MGSITCSKCGKIFDGDPSSSVNICPDCNSPELDGNSKLYPGLEIAGFKLVEQIGIGAMGQVWRAEQIAMRRSVAIKILSPSISSKHGFIDRFMNEIKNSARLDHPNIVTSFDAGSDKGFYYLVSAFVDGTSLENLLKEKKTIPEKNALKIILGIAHALEYAWNEFRILHRDIKPSNIIIDKRGTPKLLDMGVSKCITEDPSLTMDGEVVGTPYYMSPEQAKSEYDIDFRTDVYSLGTTLYHIATGHLPFEGSTTLAILTKHVTEELIDPNVINPKLSDLTCNLIKKMMAKKKGGRYQSWEEVIKEIEYIIGVLYEENKYQASSAADKPGVIATNREVPSPSVIQRSSVSSFHEGNDRKILLNKILIALIVALGVGSIYLLQIVFSSNAIINSSTIFSLKTFLNRFVVESFKQCQLLLFTNPKPISSMGAINISLKILTWEFITVSGILLSAFWTSTMAEKDQQSRLLHFWGGFFLPFIYPLFLYRKPGIGNKNPIIEQELIAGVEKNISQQENTSEDLRKVFLQISTNKNGMSNNPITFNLMDDSTLDARKILEVKESHLVLEILSNDDIKTLRLPYSRIKTFKPI